MELTEDDVLEILKLFEQSKFDFLQLQQGERKITVSKGGYVPTRHPERRPRQRLPPPPRGQRSGAAAGRQGRRPRRSRRGSCR